MELGKPYSWWFDSHTSPRRSVWLQSTISELDEKTKAMLKLVEEDADSFAQRAEMYYKRRPELVTMVGDFYRMHRSLADRFDQLKSESRISLIKPFCSPFQAKKLMNQMEKPKRAEMYYKRRPELVTMVGHRPLVERFDQLKSESRISLIKPFCSPFQAKKLLNQMEKPNDNYSQHYESGDSESEVDDPEQEEDSHVDGAMEDEHCTESEVDDPELEDKANVDREMGDGEWYEESEVDDPECEEETQVVWGEISNIGKSNVLKLKAEIEKLKEENRIQKEQLLGELSGLIHESEVAKLRDETERLIEENRIQKEQIMGEFSGLIHESEVAKLRDEIERLKKEPKEKLPGESSSLIRESEAAKLRDEIKKLKKENGIQKGQLQGEFSSCESEVAKLRDEIESLKEENRIQKEQLLGHFSSLIGEKVDEMARVKEENIVQKEQLIQKDEEKREVIRQLSLSLDILRENLMSAGNKSIVIHSKKLKGGLFSAKLFGGFFKVSE